MSRALLALAVTLATAAPLVAQPKKADPPRAEAKTEDTTKDRERILGLSVGAFATFAVVSFLTVGLLPTWVALLRGHPNTAPILAVNLLLGWLCLGWIVALVWALTAFDRPLGRHRYRRPRYEYDD
ncbi:MAG: superinfection immunity protein [Planctomycetes bacterium]|nr:superinfection immunity protein [Planctomycetota bacterium]